MKSENIKKISPPPTFVYVLSNVWACFNWSKLKKVIFRCNYKKLNFLLWSGRAESRACARYQNRTSTLINRTNRGGELSVHLRRMKILKKSASGLGGPFCSSAEEGNTCPRVRPDVHHPHLRFIFLLYSCQPTCPFLLYTRARSGDFLLVPFYPLQRSRHFEIIGSRKERSIAELNGNSASFLFLFLFNGQTWALRCRLQIIEENHNKIVPSYVRLWLA